MNKDLILREKLALQRTTLANQSTLLAFIRTAMYFLVAGVSVNNLTSVKYGNLIEITFTGISVILLLSGFINFKRQKIKINDSEKHIGQYKDEYETSKP